MVNNIQSDIFVMENIDRLFDLYNNCSLKNAPISIIVCTKGELSVEINLKEHKITPMQIMLLLPYHHSKRIQYKASDDFEGKILCINEKVIIEFNLGNIIWEKAFELENRPIIDMNEDVATLFEYYGRLLHLRYNMKGRMYQKEVFSALLQAILIELLSEVNTTITTPGKKLLKQGDILFKNFIKLLSETEIKPRTVLWYAENLHVTPKYLSTTCKKISGKSANVWINQFIIKDISQMLRHSEKSIKEIAELLDFPNLSFFGKYVKSHLGVSPKEFRQRERNACCSQNGL